MAKKIFTREDYFKILDDTISPQSTRLPRLQAFTQKLKGMTIKKPELPRQ